MKVIQECATSNGTNIQWMQAKCDNNNGTVSEILIMIPSGRSVGEGSVAGLSKLMFS